MVFFFIRDTMQAGHRINSVFQPCLTARIAQGPGGKQIPRPHPLPSLERHANLECNKSPGDSYQAVFGTHPGTLYSSLLVWLFCSRCTWPHIL